MATHGDGDPPALDEIRTQRLVITDDRDNERAVIEIIRDHVELRLLSGGNADKAEVLMFAGEQVPGTLAAGFELWVNGNSVAGSSAVITGGQVELHQFP